MSDLGTAIDLKAGAAKGLRLAVVVAAFNAVYTRKLLKSAQSRLQALGLAKADLYEAWVPGALELPLAAQTLAKTGRFDAVITLGCVIRGDTSHYDLVCEGAAQGVMQAGLNSGVPVIFGVITCDTKAQAEARCNGGPKDAGRHAAEAAVAMARLLQALPGRKKGKKG